MRIILPMLFVALICSCASNPSPLAIGDQSGFAYNTIEVEPNIFSVTVSGAGMHRAKDTESAFNAKASALCVEKVIDIERRTIEYEYWTSGGGQFFKHTAPRTIGVVRCKEATISLFDQPEHPGTSSDLFEAGGVGRVYIFWFYPGDFLPLWTGEPFYLNDERITSLRGNEYAVLFLPEGEHRLEVREKIWSKEQRKKIRSDIVLNLDVENGKTSYVLFTLTSSGRKSFEVINQYDGTSWARNLHFKEAIVVE